MINVLQAIFLGIVQGITEWLPISSSGHLVIVQTLFNLESPMLFDLVIHIATLVVIFGVFRKDILDIIRAFLKRDYKSKEFKLGIFILIGNIPIVLLGYFLRSYIQAAFSSIFVVSFSLLFTGVLLFFSNWSRISKPLEARSALLTGVFQALAIFPGISRSGATISGAMIQGISKEEAVRFSFLMAIPAFIGAIVLNFNNFTIQMFNTPFIIGFITALGIGFIFLKLLLKIVRNNKLHYFAYYCWALGIFILLFPSIF